MGYIRFIDNEWKDLRTGDAHLPVSAGALVSWLSDGFAGSGIDTDVWLVGGSPSVSQSELTLSPGASVNSKRTFVPPCAIEVVCTMAGTRNTADDSRVELVTADGNAYARLKFGGTANSADFTVSDGSATNTTTGLNIITDGTYKQFIILLEPSRVVLAHRAVDTNADPAVAKVVSNIVPAGRFSARLSTASGATNSMKVHLVAVYQLGGLLPQSLLNL